MSSFLEEKSHLRKNILTDEWVLVSPHRAKRPWLGAEESENKDDKPKYDSSCYLCPGNKRAEGAINPNYSGVYTFENDFPALLSDDIHKEINEDDLLIVKSESGVCRVICFSPRHDLTISMMKMDNILEVVNAWIHETKSLSVQDDITCIQIFENKGEVMGCSNPHPHGQIWATRSLTNEIIKELRAQKRYSEEKKRSCLLCDYLSLEKEKDDRIVAENDNFIVVVPFWACWPFELLLMPKEHLGSFLDFTPELSLDLADIFHQVTVKYDNLFKCNFPYSMGFHQRPFDGENHDEFHLHAHFYPPLLRSSTVKKFMVGFEMLGTPQRDITPENAAERLRDLPTTLLR